MKFLRNLLIATTAVAAMSATAAFADATATYTDGTVAVTGVNTAIFGDQVTVIIVPDNTLDVTEDDIYYINQDDQTGITTILAGMGMKELAQGDPSDFEVWIGGSDVSEEKPVIKIDFKTVVDSIKYGDVDGLEGVTAADATTILQHCAEILTLTPDLVKAADVDGLAGVTAADATTVLQYCAEIITQIPVVNE